jgi:hypothetical protein
MTKIIATPVVGSAAVVVSSASLADGFKAALAALKPLKAGSHSAFKAAKAALKAEWEPAFKAEAKARQEAQWASWRAQRASLSLVKKREAHKASLAAKKAAREALWASWKAATAPNTQKAVCWATAATAAMNKAWAAAHKASRYGGAIEHHRIWRNVANATYKNSQAAWKAARRFHD